jgi:hypothetical protein
MDDDEPDNAAIDVGAVKPEDLAKVISGWLTPSAPPDAVDETKKPG